VSRAFTTGCGSSALTLSPAPEDGLNASEAQAPDAGQAQSGTGKVVVLAGGTGGAKLARGMLDVIGADELVVIANTGDDIDIYGAHVSPDPDLVSFWLADEIDERGWGLRDDTFAVMDALRALGHEVWFNLGDRDLAWCLERRRLENEGLRPTEVLARLNEAIDARAQVLPMSDDPQPTRVRTDAGWRPFQEFMIRDRAAGPVREVALGDPDARSATPTPESLAALRCARAVIVGPSNPVISIWPILHVIGDALDAVTAPVVCVSPVVGGQVVKGPTAAFLSAYEHPISAAGVVAFYEQAQPGLLEGVVADEPVASMPSLRIDTAMADASARARVAEQTLAFALSLRT
jgi:LPPG:FO 2-phospho-L-lactate transferase